MPQPPDTAVGTELAEAVRQEFKAMQLPRLVIFLFCLVACGPTAVGPPDADVMPDAEPSPDAQPMADARILPDAPPPANVLVTITADNGYGFGYGTEDEMLNYFGGVEAFLAGDIFNCSGGPESYVIPGGEATVGNSLYIIAWADASTTQGVIAQFQREGGTSATYTGAADWEVCATGNNFNPGSGGPDLTEINTAIAACNSELTDTNLTSGGWVDETGNAYGRLQVGEDNTTPRGAVTAGNEFPIACNIDDDAKWMWYGWDLAMVWPSTGSPFIWPGGSGNIDKQFLIFRLSAEFVVN